MFKNNILEKHNERGYTLIEMLVVVILGAIVLTAVVGSVLLTRDSLDKYTATQATQESVSSANALMTREASISPTVITAQDYLLEFRNSQDEFIRYVYYNPASPSISLTANIDGAAPQSIPDIQEPALLEMRTHQGLTYSTITVLVDGVDMSQHNQGMALFTYYNEQNQIMNTPVTAAERNNIKRFAIRIVANSESRSTPIEVVTSVTPNEGGIPEGGSAPDYVLGAPGAPVLSGTLPRPTRNATLTWSHVAGATSYTLYRGGSAIASLTSDMELEHVDVNRAWGSTNSYFVIASGPGGTSTQSNTVALRVVPQQPQFINVNPDAAGAGSTVARNLTNHLTWTPRTGAEGYRLYRAGTMIYQGTATTFNDTGRNYGNSTQYTVVAFNTGAYGSGGDSLTSNPVTLISPPTAPVLSATHNDGVRNLSWTAPSHAQGYRLNRTTPSATTWSDLPSTPRTYTDSQAIDSATFTYRVQAENRAGLGPWSSPVSVNPRPTSVSVTTRDYTNGNDGFNDTCWSGGNNATSFEYRNSRGGEVSLTGSTTCRSDTNPTWDSITTYEVRPCNIAGCAGWSSDTGRQPPGPFSISSVSQQKRTGSWHNQNNFRSALTVGRVTYNWGASSGADSYIAGGSTYSTSNRTRGANITSGDTYDLSVTAVGNVSGLTRDSNTYRFQASPALPREITMDFQTRGNAIETRNRVLARDIRPVNGTASSIQISVYYFNGDVWQHRTGFGNWSPESGTYRFVSDVFQKSWASANSSRGNGAWFRNYKAISSGHNAGTVSQATLHDDNHPVSFTTNGAYSYVLWNRNLTSRGTPWDGNYGSSWRDIDHTPANKPGIPSNDPVWAFGGN